MSQFLLNCVYTLLLPDVYICFFPPMLGGKRTLHGVNVYGTFFS